MGLALEPLARGQQEAQVDQHQDGGGGEPLQAVGDGAEIAFRVQLAHQLVEGRRGGVAEGAGGLGDDAVQLGPVTHQLIGEGAGVVGHHIGGQAQEDDGHKDRHRQGGLGGKLQFFVQHPGEAVDHHHQEEGQGQGGQDAAQPQEGGAGHHHGDDHQGVARGGGSEVQIGDHRPFRSGLGGRPPASLR